MEPQLFGNIERLWLLFAYFTTFSYRKELKNVKLRTAKQFWRELKEADPNCPVGLPRLREAVSSGEIPTFTIGRRRVFDADTALSYLFAGNDAGHQHGGVRKIDP